MRNHRLGPFLCITLAVATLSVYAQESSVRSVEVPIGQAGFQPDKAQNTTVSFNGLIATFVASSPMMVVMESHGGHKTVALPVEFSQYESARLYQSDKLVVTGMVNGDVWEVVIINPVKGSVEDHFLCYAPAISPNGQYVAFIKFFPAHGVDSVEDHYMLYDVNRRPEQNRPPKLALHLYLYLAGRVVFPPGITNRWDENVDLDNRPAHKMASDGFFWNDQSNTVVFADEFRDEYSVVVVNIANGAFKSDSVSIPKQSICSTSAPCFERLAGVNFSISTAAGIDVVFRGVNGAPAKESHLVIAPNAAGDLAVAPGK